ncbi:type II secretion system protein [Bythopirellula polymerisocia]|uniref:Type II secretion system protein G n=1 Tax=Bythopirellula polymerisocia TaxID=2528003 RepID=A0A5C6CZ48_9BACT|nr:type II secretion system protein [Bythopirellula polymerisocia]TWU28286.1 hypothetical protein Pla144_15730 [Bythopirellula polymerisocia]
MARKKEQKIEVRGWRLEAWNPTSAQRLASSAFTLTELLVVITIIAILAALITAGAMNALNASKRARISLEINQLGQSIEEVKNKYGAYPPNGMSFQGESNYSGTVVSQLTTSDFERMFKKAFPRSQEPVGLIRRLGGATGNQNPGDPSLLPNGMNSAEAVYFWLGGFSEDTQYPLSGPGGPAFDPTSTTGEVLESRNREYEFDLGRLGPRNDSGVFHDTDNGGQGRYVTYDNPKNTGPARLRINLWRYNPSGSERPYLYFDASRHDPIDYDQNLTGLGQNDSVQIYALKKLREGFSTSNTPAPKDIVFVNKGKFQILHSGLDDAWGSFKPFSILNASGNVNTGDASGVFLFPTGPFTGDVADTLTNFTPGTLESAQE